MKDQLLIPSLWCCLTACMTALTACVTAVTACMTAHLGPELFQCRLGLPPALA